MAENLPREVVAEDQRLDAESRAKQLELARLRWHWTLDESNPARVSFRAYAAAVGRADRTIGNMSNGYADWLAEQESASPGARSLGDHIEMRKTSQTKRHAAQAIADAERRPVGAVLKHSYAAVRDLVNVAQDTAERRKTSVTEEIDRLAKQAAKDKQIDAKRKAEHKAKHTARWLSVEVKIGKAQRLLSDVLAETEGVEFIADERALMAEALGKLRAVLNLIDVRVVGTADIDWDAELAKMGEAK